MEYTRTDSHQARGMLQDSSQTARRRIACIPGRFVRRTVVFAASGKLRREIIRTRATGDAFDDFEQLLDTAAHHSEFDDLVLDDEFYKEIGEDKEAFEKHPPWAPEATDPEGYNVTFEKYLEERTDIPDYIKRDLKDAQYFGPPVVMVAGFRIEELPVVRSMVDEFIGKDVKLLPVLGREMLNMTVEDAVALPEPNWSEPRPSNWNSGGTWGSQRTLLFGGLPMEAQAAIVEVIEESGLPPVCASIASEETRHMKLGDVLADAIKLQRGRKNPEKQVWENEDRRIDDVSDLKNYYTDKLVERLKTVEDGLASGAAELVEGSEQGVLNVKMEGLEEEIFDTKEISRPLDTSETPPKAPKPPPPPSLSAKHNITAETLKPTETEEKLNEEVHDKTFETRSNASGNSNPESYKKQLDDYFAIDDLVCDEMGMERRERFQKRPPRKVTDEALEDETPPAESNKQDTPRTNYEETGNVYPITTEPESIDDNTTRNTVFSGLVQDPSKFMKENFSYDMKSGGIEPTSEDGKSVTIHVTNRAEQEALNRATNPVEDAQSQVKQETSVQDVIQEALERGVDPEQLKDLIRSLPTGNAPSTRPSFRRRSPQRRNT